MHTKGEKHDTKLLLYLYCFVEVGIQILTVIVICIKKRINMQLQAAVNIAFSETLLREKISTIMDTIIDKISHY